MKRMTFQRKMMTLFSILLLVISFLFGILYYQMMERHYIQTEEQNLKTAVDHYAQQFNFVIDQMEQVIQQILSNQDILVDIHMLSLNKDIRDGVDAHYNSARKEFRALLNSDYYKKNFNRVVYFSQNHTVICGTNYRYNPIDEDKTIEDVEWLDKVNGRRGEYIIIGAHSDNWVEKNAKTVISVVKQIVGADLGYLEVQKDKEVLDQMFALNSNNWNLCIFQKENMIYSSEKALSEEDRKILKEITTYQKINETYGNDETLVSISKEYGDGFYAVLINHSPILKNAVKTALPMSLLLVGILGSISVMYIYFMSRHMVKPIHQLKNEMEKTDISNLIISDPVEISDREIGQLYDSYREVLLNLNQSIQKERLLSELQKQAQLDLLQAQVNPHFLFNVLNVLSSRGAALDDEIICDICADLAEMLRYSTDVKRKQAQLSEEIHYLKLYLSLMKFRYEEMLEYEISIDERMDKLEIPKMALQQIVENSITHGYKQVDRVRKIQVHGIISEKLWSIEVCDNGEGISDSAKEEIYTKCAEIKEALSEKRSHVEMSIGGMGMVNTYARLYQIYGDNFSMEIQAQNTGTQVKIIVRQ